MSKLAPFLVLLIRIKLGLGSFQESMAIEPLQVLLFLSYKLFQSITY